MRAGGPDIDGGLGIAGSAATRSRRPPFFARGDGHRLRGVRRASRRAVCGAGGAGGLRPRGSPRAGVEPLPLQQRHRAGQPSGGGRDHTPRLVGDGVPAHRAPCVRTDGRRVRHRHRHRADVARTGCRRLLGPRDDGMACGWISAASARATPSIWWRSCWRTGASSGRSFTAASARSSRSSHRGGDGWPLTLSDPAAPSRVLARLSVRQTALGASGVRKGDHILDPRTGEPVRGRRRPGSRFRGRTGRSRRRRGAPRSRRCRDRRADDRVHAARARGNRGLCARSPGLEAWVLPEAEAGEADSATSGPQAELARALRQAPNAAGSRACELQYRTGVDFGGRYSRRRAMAGEDDKSKGEAAVRSRRPEKARSARRC